VVFAAAEPEALAGGPAAGSLLVPVGCVVRVDGRAGAFFLERDVVRFRELVLGEESSGRVLVEDGAQEGDRLVVDPPPTLSDGDRVIVKED